MINLIPKQAKKRLVVEYWARVFSTWGILWSVALLVGASVIFPTFILITSQVEVYETSAAEALAKVANFENVSVSLVEANQQARLILDEQKLPVFSDYIALVKSLQGDDIQISSIGLSRKNDSLEPISLSGVATDRQALASFRDRLLADEQVSSVDLPISNLAQDKNISFSITVTLHNGEIL